MHCNNHVTVHFLEVLQKNGYDLQLSLKAEGLSINFSNVDTSSDVSPWIYACTRVGHNLCNPNGLLLSCTSNYDFQCIDTLVNLY